MPSGQEHSSVTTIYYWETEDNFGKFQAVSDEEALKRKPKDCWVLYKESEKLDGFPFITIFEGKKK